MASVFTSAASHPRFDHIEFIQRVDIEREFFLIQDEIEIRHYKIELIRVRRRVHAFRTLWESKIERCKERTLEYLTSKGKRRVVYVVVGQTDLMDNLAREMLGVEAMIERLYAKYPWARRCRTLWTPTVIRHCTYVRVAVSPAVSQRKLTGDGLRKLPREFRNPDSGEHYVERRASGQRYALAVRGLDAETGRDTQYRMPFTDWVVIEAKDQPKKQGNSLRELPDRKDPQDWNENWVAKKGGREIHRTGETSAVYAVRSTSQNGRMDDGDDFMF